MIPIARSPLLHPQVLRSHQEKFAFPDDLEKRYQHFLPVLQEAQKHTDPLTTLQAIHDLFAEVLGYRSPFQATDFWEIDCNDRVHLGYFNADTWQATAEIFAGILLSEIPFDRKEDESAEWTIVTDFFYIYLYHKSHSVHFYEYFCFADFDSIEILQKFYFLFCRRNFLGNPQSQKIPRIPTFLQESLILEQEDLKEFYLYLSRLETHLIRDFEYRLQFTQELAVTPEILAKKLLYRLVFIAFQGNGAVLPQGLLTNAYLFEDPYLDRPVWDNFRAIFRWIEKGNIKQEVPAIAILLFQEDPILDRLIHIGDELCRQMTEIERFNFRENITPLMIVTVLEELIKNRSGSRKLQRWRFSKRFGQSNCTWKLLISTISGEPTPIENPAEYWLAKWQALHKYQLIDPNCSIGMRLFLGFDFLQITYNTIAHILTTMGVSVEVPTSNQILTQILGWDRDLAMIEIVQLIFHFFAPGTDRLLIEAGNIDNCSFQETIGATSDNNQIYLSSG